MNKNLISNNLKILRISKGWSLQHVADLIHVSISAYHRMEKVQCRSLFDHINEFCEIYNVSEDQLLLSELQIEVSTKK